MSWEAVQLGDVIQTLKGYAFKSSHYVESGVPIVRASNFTMDSISNDDLKFYTQDEAAQFKKYELTTNDVLIQTVGSWESNPASVVGKVVRVPQLLNGALLNQNIVKVFPADTNQLNLQYLFYRLKGHDFKRHNIGNAVGAANQASITLETIRTFTFELPSLSTQKRIAEILKGYDDLIENNQKQIKLLEEAAQRLYKEWFVDLCFPGHETTPITDGIPEGWVEGTLADLAVFKRGKTITKGQVNEGKVPVVAGGIEPAYYHDTPNTDAPVITVSGSGANAGFTRMYHTKIWASDCSYIDVSVTQDIAWIFCFLKENKASIDSMQKGAAQPHVYAKDINAMKTVVPCDSIMEQFRTMADSIFARIGKLEGQIKILAEARDRLLPKLMNGEIEV